MSGSAAALDLRLGRGKITIRTLSGDERAVAAATCVHKHLWCGPADFLMCSGWRASVGMRSPRIFIDEAEAIS